MERALALSALLLALVTVGALAVAAVGAAPDRAQTGAQRTSPRGADSPLRPGLRSVSDIGQPGGRSRATVAGPYPKLSPPDTLAFPGPDALEAARRYVAERRGRVSFALADTRGAVTGLDPDRRYRSASLAKTMVLLAYLDRLEREGAELSPARGERLRRMIEVSDNEAATALHREIGPEPMRALARRAGMRSFIPDDDSWSESRVTAADHARLFASLDRLVAARFRAFARRLLQSVAEPQSWGVPAVARPGWRVMFKGAWRPSGERSLVHQAARLERGPRAVAVAILTDGNPDQAYGEETVRQVASRLLAAPGELAAPPRPTAPARLVPVRSLAGRGVPSPPPLTPLSAVSPGGLRAK